MKLAKMNLQLFIHCPNEHVITLNDLYSDTFIYDLKSKVELKTGILVEFQNMFINNIRLENSKTLEDAKVKNGSFLRLKLKESSLEQIYVSAINGKTADVFMLGVQKIESDELDDHLNDEEEQISAWNAFVPLRAFQALFAASFGGQLKLITQLSGKSAANIKMVSKYGRSLLHAASCQGHLLCVDFLLAQGADPKLADKHGMTALMVAAENGHVKVEKRIWLFTWNKDVLDELENEEEERDRKQQIIEEGKLHTEKCKDQKENNAKDDDRIKLPVINSTFEGVSKNLIVKAQPAKLPKVMNKLEYQKSQEIPRLTSNPELNIIPISKEVNGGNMMQRETILTNKVILQTEEKDIRVSAWLQSNAAKCPLRRLTPQLIKLEQPLEKVQDKTDISITKEDENIEQGFETTSNVEEEELLFSPSQPEVNESYHENVLKNIEIGKGLDMISTYLKKEIIKTDPKLINELKKQKKERKEKEYSNDRKGSVDARFIDAIQQISDETLSFSRSLLMLSPSILIELDSNSIISHSSKSVNTSRYVHSTEENKSLAESIEISSKAFVRNEYTDRINSNKEKLEDIWCPEESLLGSTELNVFETKYGKTFNEWLEEKKQIKKEIKEVKFPADNDNAIEIEEKTEKNEEAFKNWLLLKSRERIKYKSELQNKDEVSNPGLQRGITFEDWKKIKRNIRLTHTQPSSTKRPPQRIKRGMTFDQWTSWKMEQRKSTRPEINDLTKSSERERGLSFEKWLRRKEEQKKLDAALISVLKEQEEKTKAYLLQFRLNDPRQRTFEEWYLEKKHEFLRKKKEREKASLKKKKERYPEDSSLIFNMWLLNKYIHEMNDEKRKLKDIKGGKEKSNSSLITDSQRSLGIIEETDDDMNSEYSSSSDSSD